MIRFKAYEKKYKGFSVYILETERDGTRSSHTYYSLSPLIEAIEIRKDLGIITNRNFDNQLPVSFLSIKR